VRIASRWGATFGASASTVMSTLPMRSPSGASIASTSVTKWPLAAPRQRGS
jgi:hypothetical protein